LSASIAHEVNQPLGAISSNADAVELLLDADPPKLEDAERVLLDLKKANQRASDVVIRIRGLLRKQELVFEPYDLNAAAAEVVRLLDTDAVARGVEVLASLDRFQPFGGPIAVSAGVAELLVNGMDALAGTPAGRRYLKVRTSRNEDGDVELPLPIPAAESMRPTCRACSTRSSRRRRLGWVWGWRCAVPSCRRTAAASGRKTIPGVGRP
jgi:C4-dicarboxylate-specific signal transduction histidine kinase